MLFREMVENVSSTLDIKEDIVNDVLKEFFSEVCECLCNGEEVKIHNFGKFYKITPKRGSIYSHKEKKVIPMTKIPQVKFSAFSNLRRVIK